MKASLAKNTENSMDTRLKTEHFSSILKALSLNSVQSANFGLRNQRAATT